MCSEEILQYLRGENDCKIAGDTASAACRTSLAVRLRYILGNVTKLGVITLCGSGFEVRGRLTFVDK